jgi:hypothetical protein
MVYHLVKSSADFLFGLIDKIKIKNKEHKQSGSVHRRIDQPGHQL